MRNCGYDTALLLYMSSVDPSYANNGHAAAGVVLENLSGGAYYKKNGKKYFYCETTNKSYSVGKMPDGYDKTHMVIID